VRGGGRGPVAIQHLMRRSLALVATLVLLVACSNSSTQKTASSTPATPNVLTGSIGAA